MTEFIEPIDRFGRRAFLRNGTLLLCGASFDLGASHSLIAAEKSSRRSARVGLITDLHYADKPPGGTRFYRETPVKLAEAAKRFLQEQVDFVVELGDFIDAANSVEIELGYLKTMTKAFSAIPVPKHYVLGNHCVYTLTKEEFLAGVGQQRSYYSFDAGDSHFVMLDACFRGDGTPYGRRNFDWTDPNIPADQLDWLRSDLEQTSKKTLVFVHQRLDVSSHYGVKNAADVRKVLEDSGNVLAVFQGHNHVNDYTDLGGIHYCTLMAVVEGSGVENSGYCTMDVFDDGTISIAGYRKQQNYQWS